MQGNLHKSDEGWARFRARTGNGEMARRAEMRHSAQKPSQPSKKLSAAGVAANESLQPRLRNRRRYIVGDR